ncbi:hypothetical protein QQX98_012348 [Neonectria punicea]|uniref:Uncharacterized protein n=1 Tax=Neonectria punicea TaxID=979145 RepID=A0ABR1GJ41_9HYPO
METRVRVLYQGLGLPPTTVEFAFLQPRTEYTETQLLLFHYFITKLEAKLRVNIVLESDLTEESLNMRLDALEAKYSTKDARPSAQVRQLRFSPGLLRSPTTKDMRVAIIDFRKLTPFDGDELLWAVTSPAKDLIPKAFGFCQDKCTQRRINAPSGKETRDIVACLYETWLHCSWPSPPPISLHSVPMPQAVRRMPQQEAEEGDSDQSDSAASSEEDGEEGDDEWENVTAP